MKKLNLDYILDLVDVNVSGIHIPSFNILKGDWVYISGNKTATDIFYQLLTLQINVNGTTAIFDGTNLLDFKESELLQTRRKIASLELDLSKVINDDIIVNHMMSLGYSTVTSCNSALHDIKENLGIESQSNLYFHLLKSLSTRPQILYIDFTFDHLAEDQYLPILSQLTNYVNNEGLAVIFCTNNESIKRKFVSRNYTFNDGTLIES